MLIASIVVMIGCLLAEGLFLLVAGFPFPGLPGQLYGVGFLWLLECLSVALYKKQPVYAVIAGWLMFGLMVIVLLQKKNISHAPESFLLQHSVEIIFIAASHVGYLFSKRRKYDSGIGL